MKARRNWLLAIAMGVGVWAGVGCGGNKAEPADLGNAPQPILDPTKPSNRATGHFCLSYKDDSVSISGQMDIGEDKAEGFWRAMHTQAGGGTYETNTSFTGNRQADVLHLDVKSDETGSKEAGKSQWRWKDGKLDTGGRSLTASDCPR